MEMILTKMLSPVAALVFFISAPISAHAKNFDGIVVFGGSLSDSGNAFALLGFANRPPYDQLDFFLVPSAPYSVGGNHFSNGATWIEQLAKTLSLTGSVRPAFAGPSVEGTDYAVGAARAREDNFNVNMPEQVSTFLEDFNNVADPDSLYVIDFGGNDVRDALFALPDFTQANTILQQALNSIKSNMESLYTAGARKFLVLHVPDIATLPSIIMLNDPNATFFANFFSTEFNAQLDNIIAFIGAKTGVEIATFDVFGTVDSVIQDVINNGEAFGFTNATDACIEPNHAPFKCDTPDQYLFWDGIHPTKAGHAFLAQAAAAVLNVTKK
jgi:phospholipase/lecithinase/hemolysin